MKKKTNEIFLIYGSHQLFMASWASIFLVTVFELAPLNTTLLCHCGVVEHICIRIVHFDKSMKLSTQFLHIIRNGAHLE